MDEKKEAAPSPDAAPDITGEPGNTGAQNQDTSESNEKQEPPLCPKCRVPVKVYADNSTSCEQCFRAWDSVDELLKDQKRTLDIDELLRRPSSKLTDAELVAVRQRVSQDNGWRENAGEQKAKADERLRELLAELDPLSWEEYLLRREDLAKKYKLSVRDLDRFYALAHPQKKKDRSQEQSSDELHRDYKHAAVLSAFFVGRFRWAAHRGSWMERAAHVWIPVEPEYVAKIASDTLRATYLEQLARVSGKDAIAQLSSALREACTYAKIISALSFLKGWKGIMTRAEEWDADVWELNCPNGVLNLKSLSFRKHEDIDLFTRSVTVDYDPKAMSPRWEAHLLRFLPNRNIRRHVQRTLGRALVGAHLEEELNLWLGHGSNGKSTTAKMVQRILDQYAMKAAPDLLIQTKNEQHPTSIADLMGRRVVFSIEIDRNKWLAEATAKELVGGDRIKARFMRQDFFEFSPTHSIFMILNHLPRISGADRGIWRRIKLIPWEYEIPDSDKRPQDEIVEELLQEGSGILSWLIAGLVDWKADHLWQAAEVQAATIEYQKKENVLEDFLSDTCQINELYEVSVRSLFDVYEVWTTLNSRDAISKYWFGQQLKELGFKQDKGAKGKRLWKGLRNSSEYLSVPEVADELERIKEERKSKVAKGGESPINTRKSAIKEVTGSLPLVATHQEDSAPDSGVLR